MSSTKNFQGKFTSNKGPSITVSTPVVEFWQGDTLVLFSPTLEVYGYGKNEKEAHTSFEICLAEFFTYTQNKKTFFSELKRLGWTVKKRKKKYEAPSFSKMLRKNDHLIDIMDSQDAKIHHRQVELPEFA